MRIQSPMRSPSRSTISFLDDATTQVDELEGSVGPSLDGQFFAKQTTSFLSIYCTESGKQILTISQKCLSFKWSIDNKLAVIADTATVLVLDPYLNNYVKIERPFPIGFIDWTGSLLYIRGTSPKVADIWTSDTCQQVWTGLMPVGKPMCLRTREMGCEQVHVLVTRLFNSSRVCFFHETQQISEVIIPSTTVRLATGSNSLTVACFDAFNIFIVGPHRVLFSRKNIIAKAVEWINPNRLAVIACGCIEFYSLALVKLYTLGPTVRVPSCISLADDKCFDTIIGPKQFTLVDPKVVSNPEASKSAIVCLTTNVVLVLDDDLEVLQLIDCRLHKPTLEWCGDKLLLTFVDCIVLWSMNEGIQPLVSTGRIDGTKVVDGQLIYWNSYKVLTFEPCNNDALVDLDLDLDEQESGQHEQELPSAAKGLKGGIDFSGMIYDPPATLYRGNRDSGNTKNTTAPSCRKQSIDFSSMNINPLGHSCREKSIDFSCMKIRPLGLAQTGHRNDNDMNMNINLLESCRKRDLGSVNVGGNTPHVLCHHPFMDNSAESIIASPLALKPLRTGNSVGMIQDTFNHKRRKMWR